MVHTNAEIKTSGKRGNQEGNRNIDNPNSYRRPELSGGAIGHQPIRTSGANREAKDFAKWAGGVNSGKILEQLIEECREELAHHVSQVEKLTERLQGLEELDHQLVTQNLQE